MSADAWVVCPRCKANGDIGYNLNEFREDYEIQMDEDTGVVEVIYRGECERCNLLVTFKHQHAEPGVLPEVEPNKPTGFRFRRSWGEIPAGWFVRTPAGASLEVVATHAEGDRQVVTLRFADGQEGTWPQPHTAVVWCQRGTAQTATGYALDLLGEGSRILDDQS